MLVFYFLFFGGGGGGCVFFVFFFIWDLLGNISLLSQLHHSSNCDSTNSILTSNIGDQQMCSMFANIDYFMYTAYTQHMF